jgi:hypothetical protein
MRLKNSPNIHKELTLLPDVGSHNFNKVRLEFLLRISRCVCTIQLPMFAGVNDDSRALPTPLKMNAEWLPSLRQK